METLSALLAFCAGNSPVTGEFPAQSHWRGPSMFSLTCDWTNSWANNRGAGNLRRHHAHFDVIVMDTRKWMLMCPLRNGGHFSRSNTLLHRYMVYGRQPLTVSGDQSPNRFLRWCSYIKFNKLVLALNMMKTAMTWSIIQPMPQQKPKRWDRWANLTKRICFKCHQHFL